MVRIRIEELNQINEIMRVIIKIEDEGIGLDIQTLSVMENLTFVTINNHPIYYPLLINLVKDGIVHSFEPKGDIIKIAAVCQSCHRKLRELGQIALFAEGLGGTKRDDEGHNGQNRQHPEERPHQLIIAGEPLRFVFVLFSFKHRLPQNWK